MLLLLTTGIHIRLTGIHIRLYHDVNDKVCLLNMYYRYLCIISFTIHLQINIICVHLSPLSPCIFMQWFTETPKRYVELPGPILNELSNTTLKTPQMIFTAFHRHCHIYIQWTCWGKQHWTWLDIWHRLFESVDKLAKQNQFAGNIDIIVTIIILMPIIILLLITSSSSS